MVSLEEMSFEANVKWKLIHLKIRFYGFYVNSWGRRKSGYYNRGDHGRLYYTMKHVGFCF